MAAKQPKRRTARKAPPKLAKSKRPRVTNAPATSKLDQIVAALHRPKGASVADLMTLTGWQMHSIRGALAGALKKKRGLQITSSKSDGERVYRIEARK